MTRNAMFATIEASAPAAFTLQDAQQLLYREARARSTTATGTPGSRSMRPMPSSGYRPGTTTIGPLVCTDAKCEGVRGSVNLIARLSSGTPEVRPQLRLLQNSV